MGILAIRNYKIIVLANIFNKHEKLNEFIFASEFLRDAKDMRMLEEKGIIDNDRNMEEILRDGGANLMLDEEDKTRPPE